MRTADPSPHDQPLAEVQESYDRLAPRYAEHLADELAGKPFDRQILTRFAAAVRGAGLVADLGCGPGHVARYLHDLEVEVCGIDLSPCMVEQARRLHPALSFRTGDFFSLPEPDGAFAGLVAFYSIVHVARRDLPLAFAQMRRVLKPGGPLLLAFHVGAEMVRPGELWGVPVPLAWHFFQRGEILQHLGAAGFCVTEAVERAPYEGVEHQSRRAYVLAT